MSEFYETIDNYDNYSVSTFGNVKNNTTGKILKPCMDHSGYLRIGLMKNKQRVMFYVQRLVALAFIEHIEGKDNVHHIDNNKSNNHASNLEWIQDPETVDGHKVYIKIDGVMHGLGFFATKEDAKKAKENCKNMTTYNQLLQYRSRINK